MEFFYEKVYAFTGIKCEKECECIRFLEELDNIIEKMEFQETTAAERPKFNKLAAQHMSLFVVFDQINKKFGAKIYNIKKNCLKTAVYFEVEKLKSYLNIVGKIEKLEGYLFILQKTFL